MRHVLLSADGDMLVYAMEDAIAEQLDAWAWEFRDWLWYGPERDRYIRNGVACYNVSDFIHYLNDWMFPEYPAVFVENLGPLEEASLPERYESCPRFYF